MEIFNSLLQLLQSWFNQFTTIKGSLQLGTVVGCGVLAYFTHSYWQNLMTRLLSDWQSHAFVQFLMRGSERIAFPMSMLLYLIVARFVLAQVGLNVLVLDIFTPLLLSLAAVQFIVYTLRKSFAPSPALHAWESVISLTIWGVVALHLIGWLPDVLDALENVAFDFGDTRFSILTFIKLVLATVIFFFSANWLTRFIESRMARSPYINASMRVGVAKVSKFGLYFLAIIFALNSVGIDLTSLAVFSGAVGVGIGFGLQKIFSNFISGFILLFDRSIRPGDVINIGTRFGWVQALHARYVVVRDRDGVEVLIPNENLITSEVTNWSYSDRSVRIKLPVQVSYDDDPEQAMELMLQCGKDHPRVLKDPPAVCRLLNFGDNGIELELRVWIRDPEAGVGNVRSDINLAIWKQFKQNNITIPYPQRDVHLIEE